MKLLNLFAGILFTTIALAGGSGFTFPNVPYDHARVYLFNTGENAEKSMPEFSIYRNQVYAGSKLGDGWEWTEQMNGQMNAIFRTGVDAMATGLSGCYLPRHGIIYFDKTGKPVASISLCFECLRITFWSSKELAAFSDNYSEKEATRAEKQFADLQNLFTKNNIPVFKNGPEYRIHVKAQDTLYSNNGEIIFDYGLNTAFGMNYFKINDVKAWIVKPDFKLKEVMETRFSQREGDNTSWEYITWISDKGTKISFSSKEADALLTEATIEDPEIKLPNGISVGMSLDQVQATFPVWDGIAWPSSIIVNYSDATVRYLFDHRTLIKIELVMYNV